MDEALIGAIRGCDTKEKLDRVFSLFDVSLAKDRFDALMEAMYSPQIFFSCDDPTWQLKGELATSHFLSMNWKVNALFEKL